MKLINLLNPKIRVPYFLRIKPSKKVKGYIGELKVSNKLTPSFFDTTEHRQINNLVILDNNGTSHQIDHVEIRPNGIFCIETKNLSGWIFGNSTQKTWTQTLNGKKYHFPNPIKQNESHVYHLNKILNFNYKVNSVVVFAQNNADRISAPNVINLRDLRSYLASYNDGTYYSSNEINEIYFKLSKSMNNNISNYEHVQNIRKTASKISNNICPRCGHSLVLRNGKYGEFYGCSNYPKCKFTRQK